MSPFFFSLFLFLLICTANETAKILFTFYHDRGSHFGSMLPLMEKLSIRGHSVYVFDTIFSKNKSKLINYHRAQLPQDDEGEEAKKEFANFFWYETDSSVTLDEFFEHGDGKIGILMINHTEKAKIKIK
uniref:Glucuronosyltransferase n=1 Tax=Meloidogyne hapla TaxID=6305 RepID=A0A1I8BHZ0_MELHA